MSGGYFHPLSPGPVQGSLIASVAIYSHNLTMKQVGIAELKSRLSEYIRAVRRGEIISVMDRETPVGQIVPVREKSAFRIRKPVPGRAAAQSRPALSPHRPQ